MLRSLFAFALSPVLLSATQSDIAAVQHPEIVRVDCTHTRGSAFFVGPHILITAAHVVSDGQCTINGEPVAILEKSETSDYAILESKRGSAVWLKIDCGGYVKGSTYTAIGFARGLNTQTSVDIEATGEEAFGQARLWGVFTLIPGQSGGPIEDRSGRPVGIVNTYNAARGDSGSVEIKTTSVCHA